MNGLRVRVDEAVYFIKITLHFIFEIGIHTWGQIRYNL